MLQSLQRNKGLERFVYFSTSEVFGVNSYQVAETAPPSVGPIGEARWSYAIGKLAGEHLVKSYYRDARMPTVIVRPFNVFGPRRSGDYALLRFILNALSDRPVQVHGDGTQIRAWCYIDDFCDAVLAMLERPEAVGEDFNIGHQSNTITIRDLAYKVVQMTGSRSPVVFVDHPFPDISIRVPSLTKARKVIGYNPRIDIDDGLALTIDFYRENWPAFSKHPVLSQEWESTVAPVI
jgi:nucleoside-diphosphate-sugar epimerase